MTKLLKLISIVMPWAIRRRLLRTFLGYQIDPTAHIGLAWVFPKMLIMESNSKIGDFTVCKGQDLIRLNQYASIGRLNWITSFPSHLKEHFQHNKDRSPSLIVGAHAAITHRHLIDCTDQVTIGQFSIVAGFQSQMLSHSIDLQESRQSCSPINIGSYSFVGTNCVILGGSTLPDYSVLGANSLLNDSYADPYHLYGGVPARPIKALERTNKFFCRSEGFVV